MKRRTVLTYGIIALVGLVGSALAHRAFSRTPPSPIPRPAMSPVVIREPLRLRAWEEDLPPLGVPPDPNRPIGYALLSVTFENTSLKRVEVKIESVTVRSAQNGRVISSLPSSTLILMPLEISPQQYQLFSRQGYGGDRKLTGSLVYTVEGRTYILTTGPVPVM